MKKQNIVVGVAPTKRGFLSMEEAKRQKEKFMAVIRGIHPDVVTLVDIDDICENGILFETEKITQVVEKFRRAIFHAVHLIHVKCLCEIFCFAAVKRKHLAGFASFHRLFSAARKQHAQNGQRTQQNNPASLHFPAPFSITYHIKRPQPKKAFSRFGH